MRIDSFTRVKSDKCRPFLMERSKQSYALSGPRLQSIAALLTLYCICTSAAAPQNVTTFEEALALARAFDPYEANAGVEKDVELAIGHYRRAVELRPGHPDNMPLDLRIGGWLLEGNREQRLEGLAVFEGILNTYEYMDYYEAHPNYGRNDPQYNMITVATYIGEAYQYMLKELGRAPDLAKARHFYLEGMKLLDSTYWRRLEDWRSEPAPPRPDPDSPFGGVLETSKWESRMYSWEKRQRAVESGDILPEDTMELLFVTSLVRKYTETYNPESWELAGILGPLLAMFPPGSPFEKELRRVIEHADAQFEARAEVEGM